MENSSSSLSDAVRGVIEVKTKISNADLPITLGKVTENVEFVNQRHGYGGCFHGLFGYEWEGNDVAAVLKHIQEVARGSEHRRLNCLCLGNSHFIRFWEMPPGPPSELNNVWRAYRLDEISPAYFLHNVFEHLCPESVLANNSLWFPLEGKEQSQIDEIQFIRRR